MPLPLGKKLATRNTQGKELVRGNAGTFREKAPRKPRVQSLQIKKAFVARETGRTLVYSRERDQENLRKRPRGEKEGEDS